MNSITIQLTPSQTITITKEQVTLLCIHLEQFVTDRFDRGFHVPFDCSLESTQPYYDSTLIETLANRFIQYVRQNSEQEEHCPMQDANYPSSIDIYNDTSMLPLRYMYVRKCVELLTVMPLPQEANVQMRNVWQMEKRRNDYPFQYGFESLRDVEEYMREQRREEGDLEFGGITYESMSPTFWHILFLKEIQDYYLFNTFHEGENCMIWSLIQYYYPVLQEEGNTHQFNLSLLESLYYENLIRE